MKTNDMESSSASPRGTGGERNLRTKASFVQSWIISLHSWSIKSLKMQNPFPNSASFVNCMEYQFSVAVAASSWHLINVKRSMFNVVVVRLMFNAKMHVKSHRM